MKKQKTLIYKEDILAEIERVMAVYGNYYAEIPLRMLSKAVAAMPAAVPHCGECVFGKETETFENYRHCTIDRKMHPAYHFCGYGKEGPGEG